FGLVSRAAGASSGQLTTFRLPPKKPYQNLLFRPKHHAARKQNLVLNLQTAFHIWMKQLMEVRELRKTRNQHFLLRRLPHSTILNRKMRQHSIL
ncbi:hypothetical protein NDU88_000970, partial [Pleurodeles waltl]